MLELSTSADMPYANMSDEEVLQKIVRERQIQLDKPNLAMKYADRWLVMSLCFEHLLDDTLVLLVPWYSNWII